MTVRAIPLAEVGPQEATAWRELADRAVEPNPFFDPDFVLAAARGLGELDDVGLIQVGAGAEWSACLPVRRYRRWHRLPLPCLATWLHPYCLLGAPLVESEGGEASIAAIIERMRADRRLAFAATEWAPADGPIGAALAATSPSPIRFDRFSRATLQRRDDGDYLGHVKGKHRREFRRMAKGLEAELEAELELADRAGEAGAVEDFLRLEASGWKGRGRTALADNPAHAEFFRQICRDFSARGALQLHFLEAGGQIAAARCSLLAGGASFCFKVAYDERFHRFSPGRELELRLIERFHEDASLNWMDSCADRGNRLYPRLWPDRRELATDLHPTGGPLARLLPATIRAAVALRDRRRGSAG